MEDTMELPDNWADLIVDGINVWEEHHFRTFNLSKADGNKFEISNRGVFECWDDPVEKSKGVLVKIAKYNDFRQINSMINTPLPSTNGNPATKRLICISDILNLERTVPDETTSPSRKRKRKSSGVRRVKKTKTVVVMKKYCEHCGAEYSGPSGLWYHKRRYPDGVCKEK